MSKIPHYMVELKKRNMENSTFLCKFICVQPITRLFCTILQAIESYQSRQRRFGKTEAQVEAEEEK